MSCTNVATVLSKNAPRFDVVGEGRLQGMYVLVAQDVIRDVCESSFTLADVAKVITNEGITT
jgi:hypothetical protein